MLYFAIIVMSLLVVHQFTALQCITVRQVLCIWLDIISISIISIISIMEITLRILMDSDQCLWPIRSCITSRVHEMN